ncbi:type IV pilus modification protein PilV [Acidovorax carolinensis]|uniref:Type IV pilus modification protein PilV n=1 Tax=Acidovorax carolinensis TaxID=553814 RepID=A0A240UE69_9BURK|nr:type IV pilus modification protein PilV [Acidovorax carolinensis]ART54548.1 type IV pilus modification protein PilV [Acidovorax carolinensis]ART59791.1 type IV pilus modification protein PilV [Acidovorax carolinensis]
MTARASHAFTTSHPSSPPLDVHRGFSLVEVLVAIVVLSFGLLGMVGMQAFALQSNREARLQGQAAVLARELAEMMRGNKVVGADPSTANNFYLGTFTVGNLSMGANAAYCSGVNAINACASPPETAKAEMTDWLNRVNTELPSARVTICFDGAPYDSNGMPQWACTATGADEIAVIKIGWTRASTDRSQTGAGAIESAASNSPNIIFPVTSGNATSGT